MKLADSNTIIGDELRRVRGKRSLPDMAELVGSHKNTLANYETGKRLPDVQFLVSFSNTTDADLAELIRLLIESGEHQPKDRTVLEVYSDLGIINRGGTPAPASALDPARLRLALTLAEDASQAHAQPLSSDQKADLVMTFYMRLAGDHSQ